MREIKAGYAIVKRRDKAVEKLLSDLDIKTVNIPMAGDKILLVNPFNAVEGGIQCYITHKYGELAELYESLGAYHLATAIMGDNYIFITSLTG